MQNPDLCRKVLIARTGSLKKGGREPDASEKSGSKKLALPTGRGIAKPTRHTMDK